MGNPCKYTLKDGRVLSYDEMRKYLLDKKISAPSTLNKLTDLATNVPNTGKFAEYMSKDTIIKHTGEEPLNDQTRDVQELQIALTHGERLIETAKEIFGDNYVEKTLDYIDETNLPISSKALMYISLENALGREKLENPERADEISNLQSLVYEQSQAFSRQNSLALNYARLRKIAQVGYDVSRVTDMFFTPEESTQRESVKKSVQADGDAVNKEADARLLEEVEGLRKRVEELEDKVKNKPTITAKRKKVAETLYKFADNIDKFGRAKLDDNVVKSSFAPDVQKMVADAMRYVADEIVAGKDIPHIIKDAAKRFANEKLTPDFLKKEITDNLKAAGFTQKEIEKTQDEIQSLKGKLAEFKEKTGFTVKEFVKNALIESGFGRKANIKGEEKEVLDWKKLAGRAGTVENISKNVSESIKDLNLDADLIEAVKESFINEYIDLRSSIITKSLAELKRKNKDNITPEQKTAATRLAELYTYGLFDKAEGEFENAVNKTLGINVTEENFNAARDIAKALEQIYSSTFKGTKLNDVSAKSAIQNVEDKIRLLLIDETKKQGNSAVRIANWARTFFDIQQTMVLNNLKQAVENPLSGFEQNVIDKIEAATSKTGAGTKEMATQRRKIMTTVAADMITNGGVSYGNVESLFVNRRHMDDYINKMSDNKLFHTVASVATGRVTLNAMDSMYKIGMTERKFATNLIKILTDKSNPQRMSKDEAVKFVSERLTGQTLEDARATAKEIIEEINKDRPEELIPNNKETVERFANDIVKSALEMGGKITPEQIKAAYNAAYKSAGLNIGHVANNFLSNMIVGYSSMLEGKISDAVKKKDWNRAAGLTAQSIIFRNILNPFVGGGTNWLVLRLEKNGLGLFTGLGYDVFSKKRLDLSSEKGIKELEKRLFNQARVKDAYMRGAVGLVTTALMYGGLKMFTDTDEYRKWRAKNRWAARYLDIITPEAQLSEMAFKDGKVKQYLENSFNKNDAFDASNKLIKSADYASKGDSEKAWGALGESIGSKFNTPLPWRLVKDGQVVYQGITGQDPYRGSYKPSNGFLEGVMQGGMIEYLGLRPKSSSKQEKDVDLYLRYQKAKGEGDTKTVQSIEKELDKRKADDPNFGNYWDTKVKKAAEKATKEQSAMAQGGNEKLAYEIKKMKGPDRIAKIAETFGNKTPDEDERLGYLLDKNYITPYDYALSYLKQNGNSEESVLQSIKRFAEVKTRVRVSEKTGNVSDVTRQVMGLDSAVEKYIEKLKSTNAAPNDVINSAYEKYKQ